MAPKHDTQLEKVLDEVLKSRNFKALDGFWQRNIIKEEPIRCSGQFLSKLDTLVCRSLDQKDSKSASLGLTILYKCGKHMKLPGGCHGLSGLIGQGLLEKMVQWFEKCRQLWIQCGPQWDETLYNLSEDFFDALMVVHEACKEGTTKIIESFLYPVGKLAVDPRVHILIQKEAIRKFNLILDKIPGELKKERKILASQEASDIMMKLASQILKGGDYDLQTALMEALCRMATADQRKELANRWFSMEYVASALVKIRDSEFETDCRKFLNLVNGMQGDKRRVYSYPCLEVFLDKHKLLMPADEKLEEFWIDFNLESHSISFYFSFSDREAHEGQWETICINEHEVQSYTVIEEGKRKVLQLLLSEMMVVGEIEGLSLTIHFSSSLDILQAACTVYGHRKNKNFVGKTGTSIVKTAVRITMKDDISQVVPESQMSLGESEKDTAPYLLPAQSATAQMVNPCKRRLSESTTFIRSSAGERVHGARSFSAVAPSKTPAISKGKPSLEMVRSWDRQDEFDLRDQRTTAKTCSNSPSNNTIAAAMSEKSASSLQSMASKQSSKDKVGKHKKNKPLAEAADMVLSGCGEEKSLDSSIVPDTQPRLEISINMSKLSVTEMLTQKIHSLPRPAHHSSLAQQQEAPPSAQLGSPSGSGPTIQKQLHTELTQRLQKVISERNRHPASQEQFAPRSKKSSVDIRGDSESRSSAAQVQCATGLCTNEQQTQKRGAVKEKSKRLTSPEADAAVMKYPAKTSTSKAQKKKVPSIVTVGADGVLSNREKREAKVAGGLVKLISSHYEVSTQSTAKNTAGKIPKSWIPSLVNRPIFNTSWLSTVKREGSRAVSLMKSYSKTTTNYTQQRKDIFTFNIDAPSSVMGENKTFSNTSATSSSGIHDPPALPSASKKAQPVAKEKRYVEKHLFSDTDYSTTDVSWLRESCRKPKPKVTKYSRQAPNKPRPQSPHTSYESPDLPPVSRKPVKGSTKLSKKRPEEKVKAEQPKQAVKAAPDRPLAAGRRPQRAAAIATKNYMEPDTDDSLSEFEHPAVSKHTSAHDLKNAERTHKAAPVTKKQAASKQQTESCMIPESNRRSNQSTFGQPPTSKKQMHENVLSETSKLKKKKVVPAQGQMKDSLAARQTFFSPSPPLVERMRSAERSAPTLGLTSSPLLTPRGSPLPASPDPLYEDTPSPILLLPRPRSTVSGKGNTRPCSVHGAGGGKLSSSRARSNQFEPSLPSLTPISPTSAPATPTGPSAAEINPIKRRLSSSPCSPVSLCTRPLLTSSLLELDKPSMPSPPPSPEESVNHGSLYGFSKVSSVSWVSSSQSSVHISRVKTSPTTSLSGSCKKEKTPSSDWGRKSKPLCSGPSRKRHASSSSNSNEDEKERMKKSRMKPRKLFKSCEVSRVTSSSRTMSSGHWEAEVGEGEMDIDEDFEMPEMYLNPSNLCKQFSNELKKKFQSRNNMVEVYNKQSLKTIQQHVSSLNMQVTKYRTQRLEKVQKVLLEEIHKLEQDDAVLKSMEKDMIMYWKKQSMAFHSYQEQGTKRYEALKNTLQSNVCHSVEYEENIFTSQMCMIRNDMKSVQDRLLSEMQEGELQSVKRSLHALFFP
ncbi:synaptonemal complex protein 2 [Pungitius pungitius]|uniref:synaptonemal complex protein 2 n=1 Tax=Pungitius pungitius TaxID=134920 RepID=UPI002E1084BB